MADRPPPRRQARRAGLCLCLAWSLLLCGVVRLRAETDSSSTQEVELINLPESATPKKQVLLPAVAGSAREAQAVPGAPTPAPKSEGGSEWFLEWRYLVNNTRLRGNRERSFLHPGLNHQAEYTFLHKRKVWESRQFEGMGLFRYTDDPRIDPEANSLQRTYLRLTGSTFEVNLGDFLTSYSRFSFNQNTKGLNVWKRLPVGGGLRLVGTAGVFTDRWGSIFRSFEKFSDPRTVPDPRFPNKPYTRLVLGGRVEKQVGENSFVALNFSQGSDIIRSLPREAQLRPFDNQVLSVDASLRLARDFTVAGEFAYSFTLFDARLQAEKRKDYSARLEAAHRWKRLSWRADYSRFMPNFFSVNARQVQDLQDASARLSVDITPRMILTASLRHTNDNLPGKPIIVTDPATSQPVALTNPGRTLTTTGPLQTFSFIVDPNGAKLTTTVRSPELRLQIRKLPPQGGLQITLGYREREFETSNKGSFRRDPTTGNLILDPITGQPIPLFLERVTKIPYVDLELSFRSSLLGFSYEYRHNRDRVTRTNSTFTNRFVASYRGTYYLGAWVITPGLRFETEPEAKQVVRVAEDIFFPPGALAITGHDQTRSLQGSLTVDFPQYFSLELLYRELNAELFSPFVTGGQRFFGNGGYNRPYVRAALTYKIRNNEDRYVVASYERSLNTFLSPDPTAPDQRSFRENVIQVAFVVRWRR